MRVMIGSDSGRVAINAGNYTVYGGVEEPTTIWNVRDYNIMLNTVGTAKIATIKAVRAYTDMGLKEAKDLCELVDDGTPQSIKFMSLITEEEAQHELENAYAIFIENNSDAELILEVNQGLPVE